MLVLCVSACLLVPSARADVYEYAFGVGRATYDWNGQPLVTNSFGATFLTDHLFQRGEPFIFGVDGPNTVAFPVVNWSGSGPNPVYLIGLSDTFDSGFGITGSMYSSQDQNCFPCTLLIGDIEVGDIFGATKPGFYTGITAADALVSPPFGQPGNPQFEVPVGVSLKIQDVTTLPEPGSLWLACFGLIVIVLAARRFFAGAALFVLLCLTTPAAHADTFEYKFDFSSTTFNWNGTPFVTNPVSIAFLTDHVLHSESEAISFDAGFPYAGPTLNMTVGNGPNPLVDLTDFYYAQGDSTTPGIDGLIYSDQDPNCAPCTFGVGDTISGDLMGADSPGVYHEISGATIGGDPSFGGAGDEEPNYITLTIRDLTSTPEPASVLLTFVGLLAVGLARLRWRVRRVNIP